MHLSALQPDRRGIQANYILIVLAVYQGGYRKRAHWHGSRKKAGRRRPTVQPRSTLRGRIIPTVLARILRMYLLVARYM